MCDHDSWMIVRLCFHEQLGRNVSNSECWMRDCEHWTKDYERERLHLHCDHEHLWLCCEHECECLHHEPLCMFCEHERECLHMCYEHKCLCLCLCLNTNVYVCIYIVNMRDLGSLWTKGTWMIWEVCEQLWGSANDLIVRNYECWASMNDNQGMWPLNKHKWLWTTMSNYECMWMIVRLLNNLCEWFVNVNKEWYVSENEEEIYEWERRAICEWERGVIREWMWGTIESEEQYVSEWSMSDKHLGTICTFFVRLI